MWSFASHKKNLLISAGAGISHWGKVQGYCIPKHSFILPSFACGQQHMHFLFVTFLKMSLSGNSSGLKGLQVLRKLGSLFELCNSAPVHLEFGNVNYGMGKYLERSALLKFLVLTSKE